jgi:antitoxin PrlF
MLVVAEPSGEPRGAKDPVIEAFLGFLAKDMAEAPNRITPLDAALANRIHDLVKDIPMNTEEDLGDESLV